MLTCKDISNLASDYIDNNLPSFMKLKVKMHLFMCQHCRNFLKQLSSTIKTLKALKSPQPEEKIINKQVNELMEIAKHVKSEKSDPGNH